MQEAIAADAGAGGTEHGTEAGARDCGCGLFQRSCGDRPQGGYALSQQWPKEGKWVIQLVGRNGEQFTNTLIGAGPGGVDRLNARLDMKAFAASDVEAMLK